MTKKLLAILLAISMIFVFALPVFAEDPDDALYAELYESLTEGEDGAVASYDFVDDGSYTAPNGYNYFYFVPLYNMMLEDSELSPHNYENVWDFAGLLDDSEERNLQERAESAKAEKGVNIYFLTYLDACGVSETTFTDDFYDYYITKLDFDNEVAGILYAVDMDNRQLYINTAGAYSSMLAESTAYDLLDKTYESATNGNYYSFFTKTNDLTLKKLFPSIKEKLMPTKASLIASLVVMAVVLFGLVGNFKKANAAPAGQTYLNGFNVENRNAVFMGHREEVIHDFYKQQSSGGGSHSSGGGGSHGGGGHGF